MKNKSLIIAGIIVGVLVLTITGTYAYWTITRSQENANTLIGGCLNIEISEEGESISLEKAWPISDFEGMQLDGYTFTVTNYCDEPQDYRIDLDRLVDSTGGKEMSNAYLATLLDYGVPVVYSELESEETTEDGIKEKRVLAYDTVMGKVGDTPGSNNHTLRLWIDEESPVSEQGSTFLSKVQINAGQGIAKNYTPEECFTFDSSTGSITAYDETCGGSDVVIPYEIGGVAVTQIGKGAFKEKGLTSVEFPRSLVTIDSNSFMSNMLLEKVIFKDGLTTINSVSFRASTRTSSRGALEFVMLPETLTTIGIAAFASNSLRQIILPDRVNSIGTSCFMANNIENLIINQGLSEITAHSFKHNEIKEVTIPDNITIVGNSSFQDNPIQKISFGANVQEISTSVFSNYGVGDEYKYNNQNFLTEVIIPFNTTTIDSGAFKSATSDVLIRTERTKDDFLTNVTTGSNWYGQAQVISSDGLNIY